MVFPLNLPRYLSHPGWLCLLACLISYPLAQAEDRSEIESQVKATYLCKFGNYVMWPDSMFAGPDSNIVIAVAADDPIMQALVRMASVRKVGARSITVKRLQRGEPISGIHILFVGKGENWRLNDWLTPTLGQPILSITEAEEGFVAGSVINFVVDDDRVRFDVSDSAARRNKLKLSASLMAVARRVLGKQS